MEMWQADTFWFKFNKAVQGTLPAGWLFDDAGDIYNTEGQIVGHVDLTLLIDTLDNGLCDGCEIEPASGTYKLRPNLPADQACGRAELDLCFTCAERHQEDGYI